MRVSTSPMAPSTVGAAMAGEEIAGFFEYHTQDITLEKLEGLLRDLADGKISHQQILSEGGHGAFTLAATRGRKSPDRNRTAAVALLLTVVSEVMAEGHIHAYGALRGRAMAGVSGDRNARIFCRKLFAELVSIAGCYRVSENLESRYLGRAVQISLADEALKFELL